MVQPYFFVESNYFAYFLVGLKCLLYICKRKNGGNGRQRTKLIDRPKFFFCLLINEYR